MLKKFSVALLSCGIFIIIFIIGSNGSKINNGAINSYLLSLKYNSYSDKYETSLLKARSYNEVNFEEANEKAGLSPASIDGFSSEYHKIKTTIGIQNLAIDSTNKDFIYPGALININPLNASYSLAPINGLTRAPITLIPSFQGISSNIEKKVINDITAETIKNSLIEIPENDLFKNSQFPFTLSSEIVELKSPEDLNIALGISPKININSKLVADFDFVNKSKKTYAIMVIKQIFYKAEIEYPTNGESSSFFDKNTGLADIKSVIKDNMTPTYVSSVSYGRTIAITIKSNEESALLGNKIIAKLTKYVGNNQMTADLVVNETLNNTELNFYQLGEALNDATTTENKKYSYQIQDILNSKFDINTLTPISFTLAHLGNGSNAKVGFQYESYAKQLTPNSVSLIYFNLEKSKYIKTSAMVGSNNIELTAVKNPTTSTLFPLEYRIKNAQYNSNNASMLKDKNNNIIARINKEYQESTHTYKYYLSISSDTKNIDKVFNIIASADNLSAELEVKIMKVPVERVDWINDDNPQNVEAGQKINLMATAYPINSSFTSVNYQIINGNQYAEINNGALIINESAPENAEVEVVATIDSATSSTLTFTVKKTIIREVILKNSNNLITINPDSQIILETTIIPSNAAYQDITYFCDHQSVIIEGNILTIDDTAAVNDKIEVYAEVDGVQSNQMDLFVSDETPLSLNISSNGGFNDLIPGTALELGYALSPSPVVDQAVWSISNGNSFATLNNNTLTILETAPSGSFPVDLTLTINEYSLVIETSILFEVSTSAKTIELIPSSDDLLNLIPGDTVSFAVNLDNEYEELDYEIEIYNNPEYVTFSNNILTIYPFDGKASSNNIYLIARIGELESNKIAVSIKNDIRYIETVEELKNIDNYPNDNYLLLNDLDLSSEQSWKPLKHFSGTLDGNNYTISNLEINEDLSSEKNEVNFGLFAKNDGIIKNLNLENFNYKVDLENQNKVLNIGCLVGLNFGTLENITLDGTMEIKSNNSNIGGIVGKNNLNGEISNCISKVSIKGSGDIGGIAGENNAGLIDSCTYQDATIEVILSNDNQTCGGIVGNLIRGGLIENSNVDNIEIVITTLEESLSNEVVPFIGFVIGKLESSNAQNNQFYNSEINLDNLLIVFNSQNIVKGLDGLYGNKSGTIVIN